MKNLFGSVLFLAALAMVSCNTDDGLGDWKESVAAQSYEYVSSGSVGGHEYVDLGLSVKWATCNVGADTPDQPGIYVAFGEVESKPDYSWKSYTLCFGSETKINKYNILPEYNGWPTEDKIDYQKTLLPADDAATHHWGNGWRMPTDEEITELRTQCQLIWCNYNGVNGVQVLAKNGNSIFIPAGGFYVDGDVAHTGSNGCIWSSNISNSTPSRAYEFTFFHDSYIKGSVNRFYGENIRPVLGQNAPQSNPPVNNDSPSGDNNDTPSQDNNDSGNDNGSDNGNIPNTDDNEGNDTPPTDPSGDMDESGK